MLHLCNQPLLFLMINTSSQHFQICPTRVTKLYSWQQPTVIFWEESDDYDLHLAKPLFLLLTSVKCWVFANEGLEEHDMADVDSSLNIITVKHISTLWLVCCFNCKIPLLGLNAIGVLLKMMRNLWLVLWFNLPPLPYKVSRNTFYDILLWEPAVVGPIWNMWSIYNQNCVCHWKFGKLMDIGLRYWTWNYKSFEQKTLLILPIIIIIIIMKYGFIVCCSNCHDLKIPPYHNILFEDPSFITTMMKPKLDGLQMKRIVILN